MNYNIKTKTSDKCRIYPDSPNGPQPSVTSITDALHKWALVDWAANCAVDYIQKDKDVIMFEDDMFCLNEITLADARTAHKRISKEARDTGTDIHLLCQLYLESYCDRAKAIDLDQLLITADEKSKALFEAFRSWCEKEEIEPVYTELVLHGDGYSGRCDLVARRKGALGLYDIKTGKGSYYPEWGLQVVAYAEAYDGNWQEQLAKQIAKNEDLIGEIGIIKLNKQTLKCNFSEDRGPKFTRHRERLTKAFLHLKDFYWLYNDLEAQFTQIPEEAK